MTIFIMLSMLAFLLYIFTIEFDFFLDHQKFESRYYVLNRVLELDKPSAELIDGALELTKKRLTFIDNRGVYH